VQVLHRSTPTDTTTTKARNMSDEQLRRRDAMTRFADVHVFGPEAAIQAMQRQAATDEPKPDGSEPPKFQPEAECHDDRDTLARRERALRHSWHIGPR
jgi:hypothetical protein